MEENKNLELELAQLEEEKSSFDFKTIYRAVILNWKWFLLSLIVCLGLAALYLRYTTPTYQAYAKLLVKNEDNNGRGRSLQNATNLGMISNSEGLENEMEILKSKNLAMQTVRDLKFYVSYTNEGRIKDMPVYKSQAINVDMDAPHLEDLSTPVDLVISRDKAAYNVEVILPASGSDKPVLTKKINKLPAKISTKYGIITLSQNTETGSLAQGSVLKARIVSPKNAAGRFAGSLGVGQTSKGTSIIQLSMIDQVPQRAVDYLKQLAVVYNRQANEDKNVVALRTEQFINSRLEKINNELSQTEGQLQSFKERNRMVNLPMNAGASFQSKNEYDKKMVDAQTQIDLLNSVSDFMNEAGSNGQVMPSNIGLSDPSATALINRYNELVLERNRLLQTASESSPVVEPLTQQIQELRQNIRGALNQSRRNLQIQRNAMSSQMGRFSAEVSQTPQQERILTEIGRQQEVRSGLYMMLLQKREENSISLAATADKGKLIDEPQPGGQVAPKSSMILLIGLLLGLAIPAIIIFLTEFFRYKIEGHEDVERLTKLPILADVAVANESAKGKAGLVVQENKNNQMEEIFRSLRTNVQFMMKENDKVIMFTSTTSGEGKTFNCANLSMSFALLGKKVVLVGLDIRKPRLAELFGINDHKHGITPLLMKDKPTLDDVENNIVHSGVNANLDLLLAGPIPPNPTELISRSSLEDIFNILRQQYDFILVDTAPVGLVSDTLEIGRIADATIYICRSDYTPKSSFDLVNSLAVEKKLPNMAVVINGIDMSKKKYGYYYGYGRYGKYGRYGRYKSRYGSYGRYGNYATYGNYSNSHYGNKDDHSVKK